MLAKFEELDATLRALYEQELIAARMALDDTTAFKAAAELKVKDVSVYIQM